MEEITIICPTWAFKKNSPLSEDIVPVLVPSMMMLAPGIVSWVELSMILPRISSKACASIFAEKTNSSSMTSKFSILRCLLIIV